MPGLFAAALARFAVRCTSEESPLINFKAHRLEQRGQDCGTGVLGGGHGMDIAGVLGQSAAILSSTTLAPNCKLAHRLLVLHALHAGAAGARLWSRKRNVPSQAHTSQGGALTKFRGRRRYGRAREGATTQSQPQPEPLLGSPAGMGRDYGQGKTRNSFGQHQGPTCNSNIPPV